MLSEYRRVTNVQNNCIRVRLPTRETDSAPKQLNSRTHTPLSNPLIKGKRKTARDSEIANRGRRTVALESKASRDLQDFRIRTFQSLRTKIVRGFLDFRIFRNTASPAEHIPVLRLGYFRALRFGLFTTLISGNFRCLPPSPLPPSYLPPRCNWSKDATRSRLLCKDAGRNPFSENCSLVSGNISPQIYDTRYLSSHHITGTSRLVNHAGKITEIALQKIWAKCVSEIFACLFFEIWDYIYL